MTISRRPSQPRCILGRESDLVFLRYDFGDAPLEIEARRQFLARLIERIINFLRVHFRDDIERRHDDLNPGFLTLAYSRETESAYLA